MIEGRETTMRSNCSLCAVGQRLERPLVKSCRDQVFPFGATRPKGLDFSLHQAAEVAQTFFSVALELVQQLHASSNPCQLGNHRLHSIEPGRHVHVPFTKQWRA